MGVASSVALFFFFGSAACIINNRELLSIFLGAKRRSFESFSGVKLVYFLVSKRRSFENLSGISIWHQNDVFVPYNFCSANELQDPE